MANLRWEGFGRVDQIWKVGKKCIGVAAVRWFLVCQQEYRQRGIASSLVFNFGGLNETRRRGALRHHTIVRL